MSKNGTINYSDIDVSQIKVENVKLGSDTVTMIRYGRDNRELIIQCPSIRMNQYGLPPGETLNNGSKNEYYTTEEARDSMKFPLDADNCNVSNEDNSNNKNEITAFIKKLKEIDEKIKNSNDILEKAGIDIDDKEKYTKIFRNSKSKKVGDKVKYSYIKTKLKINYKNKKEIQTEFYEVDRNTKKASRVVSNKDYILLEDLEKLCEYNCEQQPIIQFVKVWTQSSGQWGVTVKLLKSRIKKGNKSSKSVSSDFIDDDTFEKTFIKNDDSEEVASKKLETKAKNTSPVESDNEVPPPKSVKKVVAPVESSDDEKQVPPKNVKKAAVIATVDSSDSDEPVMAKKTNDLDSESDSEPEVKPVKKKPAPKTASKSK
jgi:hypothetical protein